MLFKDITIIDKDFKAVRHQYVRTEGAFITYIGDADPRTIPEAGEIEGEEVYDGKNKALVPGFYNVHCHVPMTLLRGYGEGLPLQRWLFEKIFPFEAKLTPRDIQNGTLLGALELMASGSVSISDMYFSINEMAEALESAGMKANICHGISSSDAEQKLTDLPGYQDTLRLSRDVRAGVYGGKKGSGEGSRIKADMGLHAEYTSTEGLVRQIANAAKEEGLSIHVHISETESEHRECMERHEGRTPIRYMADCGALDVPVQAAHCVYLSDEDVEIMKAHGAAAVHNPSSNLKLGSGIAPVRDYLKKGLKVALGTDGASSNNNLNMMEEIHMAAMICRGVTKDANAVSASDILRMASLEGARVQGRRDCGRIEKSCRADLLVFDLDKPHLQPDFDTVANIVFAAQSSDIVLNMIDGRVVYRNGEFLTLDKERVIYDANASFQRILTEL